MRELAETVGKAMGVAPQIRHLDARNEVVNAWSSHAKAARFFGDLVRNVPLAEGVARMAAWARRTGARAGQTFEGIEVNRGMPASWAALIKGA